MRIFRFVHLKTELIAQMYIIIYIGLSIEIMDGN